MKTLNITFKVVAVAIFILGLLALKYAISPKCSQFHVYDQAAVEMSMTCGGN